MINPLSGTIDLSEASLQKLNHPIINKAGINATVLRLDKIDLVISGNKFFKLKNYLQDAIVQRKSGLATFGGVWSNHLIATARACSLAGMKSIGFIRGEMPPGSNAVLNDLLELEMKLIFLTREEYSVKNISRYTELIQEYIMVPEGGSGEPGISGAADIMELINREPADIICCSIGTGTTMAGLIKAANNKQRIIGFSSLKLNPGNEIEQFLLSQSTGKNIELIYDYHFGGYARISDPLIGFMNEFYNLTGIPTDRVYTAKMFYGFLEEIKKGKYSAGTDFCLVHSGGLSGNRSLKPGILSY